MHKNTFLFFLYLLCPTVINCMFHIMYWVLISVVHVPDSFSLNAIMQTKKSMESSVPYVVLGILYAYLLCLSWTPETVALIFASKYLLPEVCIHQLS